MFLRYSRKLTRAFGDCYTKNVLYDFNKKLQSKSFCNNVVRFAQCLMVCYSRSLVATDADFYISLCRLFSLLATSHFDLPFMEWQGHPWLSLGCQALGVL